MYKETLAVLTVVKVSKLLGYFHYFLAFLFGYLTISQETGLILDKVQVVSILVTDRLEFIVLGLDRLVHRPKGSHKGTTVLVHVHTMSAQHAKTPKLGSNLLHVQRIWSEPLGESHSSNVRDAAWHKSST